MLDDDEVQERPTFPDDPTVQHGHLARSLTTLQNAVKASGDGRAVRQLLDHLIEDLRQHFAAEEHAMERAEDPQLDDHRERHHKFLLHLERVRADAGEHASGFSPAVAEQVERWFHDHEQTADADLRAFLTRRR